MSDSFFFFGHFCQKYCLFSSISLDRGCTTRGPIVRSLEESLDKLLCPLSFRRPNTLPDNIMLVPRSGGEYLICIVFVFYLYCICIVFVLCLYCIFIVFVLCFLCIVFVLYFYCFCIVFVLYLCGICIVFVLYLYCVCIVFVLRLYCICIVFVLFFLCICI